MAENIDEENLDNPTYAQSESLPVENTPVVDTETIKLNQETENMEVHHHAHHEGKKNWKSYVWEFLMLFLAVFCGFLAEYQLEHKIEKDRARELAKSFYQELKNDSATAVIKVNNRIKQENALLEVIKYFKDSSLNNVTKSFAINFNYGVSFRTPSIFEPKTTILEQLKNSGSLRYFKNDELQSLIGDLTVSIKNIYDRQELESQVRMQFVNPILMRICDYDFDTHLKENGKNVFEGIKEYESSNDNFPFHIDEPDNFDKKNAIRVLNFYRANVVNSTRVVPIKKYMEVNAELLKVLRNEYNLD